MFEVISYSNCYESLRYSLRVRNCASNPAIYFKYYTPFSRSDSIMKRFRYWSIAAHFNTHSSMLNPSKGDPVV